MKKLLTLKDIMEVCNVGYSTVYRWRKNKTFPESVGVGKLLWTEQQITEWLDRQSAAPPPVNVPTTRQKKQKEREHKARQDWATATLEKHRRAKGKSDNE